MVMVTVYVSVVVSWMVVVMTVNEPLIDVVRRDVLSKVPVDMPVVVWVIGVDEALTFKPPVGRRSNEPLVVIDQPAQVWLLLDSLEVVEPDTSVLEVVVETKVSDQSDQTVLLAEEVETTVVLGVEADGVVLGVVLGVELPRSGVVAPHVVADDEVVTLSDVVGTLEVSGPETLDEDVVAAGLDGVAEVKSNGVDAEEG